MASISTDIFREVLIFQSKTTESCLSDILKWCAVHVEVEHELVGHKRLHESCDAGAENCSEEDRQSSRHKGGRRVGTRLTSCFAGLLGCGGIFLRPGIRRKKVAGNSPTNQLTVNKSWTGELAEMFD